MNQDSLGLYPLSRTRERLGDASRASRGNRMLGLHPFDDGQRVAARSDRALPRSIEPPGNVRHRPESAAAVPAVGQDSRRPGQHRGRAPVLQMEGR